MTGTFLVLDRTLLVWCQGENGKQNLICVWRYLNNNTGWILPWHDPFWWSLVSQHKRTNKKSVQLECDKLCELDMGYMILRGLIKWFIAICVYSPPSNNIIMRGIIPRPIMLSPPCTILSSWKSFVICYNDLTNNPNTRHYFCYVVCLWYIFTLNLLHIPSQVSFRTIWPQMLMIIQSLTMQLYWRLQITVNWI